MHRCGFFLFVLLASLFSFRAEAGPPRGLQVLARYPVPAGSVPTDVRWASEDSILVSRAFDGVVELELGPQLARRRHPVPDQKTFKSFGTWPFDRLAVSPQYLAFAAAGDHMAWRPLARPGDGNVVFPRKSFGIIEDLDLSGDRLLFLGTPSTPEGVHAPQGGIAWLGTLRSDLDDLKPVLHDLGGPDVPPMHLYNCSSLALGAVRFLADGSFLVVPGFQPGAHLFSPAGRPVRAWSDEELTITTDCSGLTKDFRQRLRLLPDVQTAWLNQRRVLDDILPLPEGPGLLVRYQGKDGLIHWDLKVLRTGGVDTYPVPLAGRRPFDRLQGDVRGGKIVLLLASFVSPTFAPEHQAAEIVVAELR